MRYNPMSNSCLFNTLYIQYVEDIGQNEYFSFDLKYPLIYNVQNGYFQVDNTILSNLNNTISSSVYDFKDGIYEEEKQINDINPDGSKTKINYKVFSNYDITFNKNQVVSIVLSLMALDDNSTQYSDLYSYNMDLLTGNQLSLKDIFKPNTDYLKLVSDFINLKISQQPSFYYPNTSVNIPDDQSFYLTDKGIVIYFGLDEISPAANGVPKFLMPFEDFQSYINPRFYCNIANMNYNKNNNNERRFSSQHRRGYFSPQHKRYY